VSTEEEIGYQDAIHQMQRVLQRRIKTLEDESRDAQDPTKHELKIRLNELEYLLHTLSSLHR